MTVTDHRRRRPKNIVLLSDGTGNSSAKLMKTNVWRMYEAVDLTKGDQFACYDNGVGTSSFKPLAVLGGAIGWGLKRNVRHLYTYACTHYEPARDGRAADQIYGFGFSRGAFTMRVLMAMIESEGLVTGVRGRELQRLAKHAYRRYRSKFNPTGSVVGPLRWVRDRILRLWDALRGHTPYENAQRVRPEVAFVGLWDTVDAYGLPIDEMTRGWDRWVWPLSMCEHRRPSNVAKICHAVAIDDERHTFHPVLLDERTPDLVPEPDRKALPHTDNERVTQVWFAGVHSNVGGGYPDDSLAHVSLRWMANEAGKKGLRLHPHLTQLWESRADPHGPASDPRRGLGAYYRYNPRSIKKLTDDRFADVVIERPKIHHSVFDRILVGRDDYAPLALPQHYDIVGATGEIIGSANNPYEHESQAADRCARQERVWNLVWMRRGLYFSTVTVTLALVLLPLLFKSRTFGNIDLQSGTIAGAVRLVGTFMPGMAQPLTTFWEDHPVVFAILTSALAGLFIASTLVQRQIYDGMRQLWEHTARSGVAPCTPSAPPRDLAYRIRSHPGYRGATTFLSHKVFPFVFGFAALLAVILLVTGTVNRALFTVASVAGVTCPGVAARERSAPGTWSDIHFVNTEMCQPTGIELVAGRTYDVSIALSRDWADKSYRAGLAGFASSEEPLLYYPALPFRRVLREQWFVPIARLGRRSPEYYPLTQPTTAITPRRTAHLYLFVNDAVGLPLWWDSFYKNNIGTATVTVVERPEGSIPATSTEGAEP